MTENECEIVLELNPTDNLARFRLAELLIQQNKNIEMAKKLIETIVSQDKKFMKAEIFEL